MDSRVNEPLVTVITVTYNLINNQRKDAFVETINSVQNQSYKNIEHIIVDGASDDGTADLINKYVGNGVFKFISEPDEGLYDAMNKGAQMARGKYILFLNSDDYLSGKDAIKKAVELLEKNKCDYTFAKAKIIDCNNNLMPDYLHNSPDLSKVFTEMPFCHQTLVLKTDLFKSLGMFDLEYRSAADYDFVQKLVFSKCKAKFIPYEFVVYRVGGFAESARELSINEMVKIFYKNYNRFCKISLEDCQDIQSSKTLPIQLLLKLLKNSNLGVWAKFKLLARYFHRKIIRARISLSNPSLVVFGKKII